MGTVIERHAYMKNADGTVSYRNTSEYVHDQRDLNSNGDPKHPLLRYTKIEKQAGEVEFNHRLTDQEIEHHFPGTEAAIKENQRVAAIREAIRMAAHDDEVGFCFDNGILKLTDIHDLHEINERRKLRRMPIIGGT